jgi:hypothetical protein
MISAWVAAGAAGAAAAFAANPWPAPGQRLRNGMLAALAMVVAAGLWLYGFAEAWGLAAGWYAAFLLLQSSHRLMAPGTWLWARIAVAAGLVVLSSWWLEGMR